MSVEVLRNGDTSFGRNFTTSPNAEANGDVFEPLTLEGLKKAIKELCSLV